MSQAAAESHLCPRPANSCSFPPYLEIKGMLGEQHVQDAQAPHQRQRGLRCAVPQQARQLHLQPPLQQQAAGGDRQRAWREGGEAVPQFQEWHIYYTAARVRAGSAAVWACVAAADSVAAVDALAICSSSGMVWQQAAPGAAARWRLPGLPWLRLCQDPPPGLHARQSGKGTGVTTGIAKPPTEMYLPRQQSNGGARQHSRGSRGSSSGSCSVPPSGKRQ